MVWSSSAKNPGQCACGPGSGSLLLDLSNLICSYATYDPNKGATSIFSCKSGYKWSQAMYPYQCVTGFNIFSGFYSASASSYTSCSSATNTTACGLCDPSQGYLLIQNTGQCLLCSTVTGSTGTSLLNGCVCSGTMKWNAITLTCDAANCSVGYAYNPTTQSCVCDPTISVTISSTCYYCGSISQSTGYAVSASACGCVSPYSWAVSQSGGVCSQSGCNSTTQILLSNGTCFNCPTASGNGNGYTSGVSCVCNNGYFWNPTSNGGTC